MISKQVTMQSGCTVHSNESRVAINLPSPNKNDNLRGWTTLSSATYNGGLQSFTSSRCGVINIKVPPTYDGINPNPAELIDTAIKADTDVELDANATVGMMTAANLNTVRTSSRSSKGVVVDAIVTAGISNARAVGADADCFFLKRSDDTNEHCPEPGTINTVVIINTPLTESAMIEAYAIAIEAKCAACAELSVLCSKSGMIAQGTGTDCLVLACPSFKASHYDNPSSDKPLPKCNSIEYAGKHMLLGEFIGQAVKEATCEAILCNIRELHGSIYRYHLHRYLRWITNLILCGARPCVPPYPMMPVPSAPMEVLALGVILIITSYLSGLILLPRKATVLLGAAAWDRYVVYLLFCLLSIVISSNDVIQMPAVCSTCDPSRGPSRKID
jgi:adenosylcobinamide amidohydrolase